MRNEKQKPLDVSSPIKPGTPINALNKRTKAFPFKLVSHGDYLAKKNVIHKMWEQQQAITNEKPQESDNVTYSK